MFISTLLFSCSWYRCRIEEAMNIFFFISNSNTLNIHFFESCHSTENIVSTCLILSLPPVCLRDDWLRHAPDLS